MTPIRLCMPILFALVVTATPLRSLSAGETNPNVVKVGYFGAVNSQLLAKRLNLDSEAVGVPIEWLRFESGRDVVAALASGSIDIGEIGFPPAITAIAAGIPIEGIFISHLSGPGVALFIRPGKNIAEMKDLVGKKVGVPFGTNPHYLLITALQLEGVDPKQVTLLDLSPSEMLAAFLRKEIDAGYVWQPTLGKVIEAGAKVLLTSADMAERGYPTGDVEVVRREFSQKYPTTVSNFVRGENKAAALWLADQTRAAEIVSQELSMSPKLATRLMMANRILAGREQLEPAYLGTSATKGDLWRILKSVANFLVQEGRLKMAPSDETFRDFINPSYLEKAL